MSALIAMVVKWLARKAMLLALILALLIIGVWIRGEWTAMSNTVRMMEEKRIARDLLAEHALNLKERAEQLTESSSAVLRDFREKERRAEEVRTDIRSLEAERARLWDDHWWARKNPLSSVSRKIMILDANIALRRETAREAERLKRAARQLVDASPELKEARALLDEARNVHASIDDLDGQIAADDAMLKQDPIRKLLAELDRQLPLALTILAGIILLPIVIKAGLYFLVAPVAARFPPLRILPDSSGLVQCTHVQNQTEQCRGRISSVSNEITIHEYDELLIHADYLQSCSLAARKRTKWLLNARLPFSSLASGMFALVRIVSDNSATVVVSSSKDPLSEVGTLLLSEGSALVCKPRALAGVLKRRGSRLHITRHWRFFRLHAWLTMQLRYIVFHGPCTLIMKGCRGVRVEQANEGRLINQAATLAFSANVSYANSRCETFVSYWTGKEDLFNDSFSGSPGVYIYEELPDARRRTGVTGRGLEGIVDSFLKVFGV